MAPGRRRKALVLPLAGLLIGGSIVWAFARTGNEAGAPDLGTRTVQAGVVEVRMTALTLDASGATFRLDLDTHSGALDVDPASTSRLRIGGKPVTAGTWRGQRRGGHHLEGTLRFATPVPAGASVELRVTGLPQSAAGTWTAP